MYEFDIELSTAEARQSDRGIRGKHQSGGVMSSSSGVTKIEIVDLIVLSAQSLERCHITLSALHSQ